jgi:ankyrin repeat protein
MPKQRRPKISANTMSRSPFLSLPTEIHNLIFSYLKKARKLYALSRTCRYFSVLAAPYLFKLAVKKKNAYVLRWAASINNATLMQRLLHAGVDVSATESRSLFDYFGEERAGSREFKTALEITLEAGHIDALKVLLDHGGAVRVQLPIILRTSSLLQSPTTRCDIPMLEMLLEYVPLDQRNDGGYLVWGSVVSGMVESGKTQIVGFFLDLGWEFDASTSLHDAASGGHTGVASLLLERGIIEDIDARTKRWDGMSALDLAAKTGKIDLIELLMDKGAKLDTSEDGITPAHIAAEYGCDDALEFLVHRGVDVNAASDEGTTPIHIATLHYHYSTLELLIRMGGDVNARDSKGHAALYHAAKADDFYGQFYDSPGSPDIARTYGVNLAWLLLRNGAALDQQDNNGWTAMDAAVWGGRIGMARVLLMARKLEGIENFASSLEELYESLEKAHRGDDVPYIDS